MQMPSAPYAPGKRPPRLTLPRNTGSLGASVNTFDILRVRKSHGEALEWYSSVGASEVEDIVVRGFNSV
jgi:hypothetical protein